MQVPATGQNYMFTPEPWPCPWPVVLTRKVTVVPRSPTITSARVCNGGATRVRTCM